MISKTQVDFVVASRGKFASRSWIKRRSTVEKNDLDNRDSNGVSTTLDWSRTSSMRDRVLNDLKVGSVRWQLAG